ncbi:MAG: hypothetical protein ACQEUZ_02210 [Pseudomonadota bacterium]
MAYETQRIFELLPAILRLRDFEAGRLTKGRAAPADPRDAEEFGPLKTLISLIAREAQIVEEEIDQLYDDFFIETCAPWVIPYIGDLIGVRGLGDIPEGLDLRGQVANAIPLRQRKGTLAALEQAATDASNWPVAAVEYWRRLVHAQSMRLVHPGWGGTADLRDRAALARIGTPFDPNARGPEMRRIAISAGRWNLPDIGLHAWRLKPCALSRHRVERVRPDRRDYRFHPLGCDAPLFAPPADRPPLGEAVSVADVPAPVARRLMAEDPAAFYPRALEIETREGRIPVQRIRVCHLGDRGGAGIEPAWNRHPREDVTLIDPELGRFVLARDRTGPVRVSCAFGRVEDAGGGEHDRAAAIGSVEAPAASVPPGGDLAGAVAAAGGEGVVLLEATGPYALSGTIATPDGATLRLVADQGAFPTLDIAGGVTFALGRGASVELNGLRLQGGPARVEGPGAGAALIDCTLVPGRRLNRLGDPVDPGAVALEMAAAGASLAAERCVLGPVRVAADVDARFIDCALDAGRPDATAYAPEAGAERDVLRLKRCTVVGRVACGAFGDAAPADSPFKAATDAGARFATTDTLFHAAGPEPVRAARRQIGCLRFCYVPEGSRTPRRRRCVSAPPPVFASRRYADAGYLLLDPRTSEAILRGAENGGEMGVWNRAAHQARDDNLRRVIGEFLRFGREAGVFHET